MKSILFWGMQELFCLIHRSQKHTWIKHLRLASTVWSILPQLCHNTSYLWDYYCPYFRCLQAHRENKRQCWDLHPGLPYSPARTRLNALLKPLPKFNTHWTFFIYQPRKCRLCKEPSGDTSLEVRVQENLGEDRILSLFHWHLLPSLETQW